MVKGSLLVSASLVLSLNAFGSSLLFGPGSKGPIECRIALGDEKDKDEPKPDPNPGTDRKLKPEYKAQYIEHNTNKVIEVPNQGPIENQQNRGFCHMYSLYEELVREFKTRNEGKDPNISIYYWTYFHWLPRAIETATDVKAPLAIPEGSWYENTFDIIKSVGVITKNQWAAFGGKTDIETQKKDFIEMGQLKTIVTRAHLQKELLLAFIKPEIKVDPTGQKITRSKYFNMLFTNPTIMQELNTFILQKSRASASGKTAFKAKQIQILKDISKGQLRDMELTPTEVAEMVFALNQDITADVTREFNMMYFAREENPLPSDLSKYKDQAREMFPETLQKTISFVTNGERFGITQFEKAEKDHVFFSSPLPDMVKIIQAQIDSGNSVWLGYDHNSYFVDGKTGAMTLEGMMSKPMNPQISLDIRTLKDIYYGGHAVQIVGYEINKKGQIVAFKIQNSWGDDVGNKGYFRMDMSYFMAYVWRVTIRDEEGGLTDDVIKFLKATKKSQTQSQGQRGYKPPGL